MAERIKYVEGYVKVSLKGYAQERFLNLCANHKITLWNVKYKQDHYEFCISISSFRKVRPLLRKTKTKLHILKRYGLPFFLHRYRKRKLFVAGILLCGCLLYSLSLFVWEIQVQGNLHRTDDAILKFLQKYEISPGILRKKLDCGEIEELLRSGFDDIIWASVKIQGTRLVIDLQENLATEQKENQEDFSDAIASDLIVEKDAEIYSIFTRAGTPLVKAGDQVTKNDVLVEGKIPIYDDNGEIVRYQFCKADADILGITIYSYQDKFSLDYQEKIFTENQVYSYRLRFFDTWYSFENFGWNIFGKEKKSYQNWERITTEIPLKLGKNFYLPAVLYQEVTKEYQLVPKKYTKKEAKEIAENKLNEFCEKLQQKGIQILENNVIIIAEGNVCIAKGTITVKESLGVEQVSENLEMTETENQNTPQMDDSRLIGGE